MIKQLRFFPFIFFILFYSASAQESGVSIGAWREHIPFNKSIALAEDDNQLIYCASQFGIFTYSKTTGELTTLSRLKELSDLEVTTIRYDNFTKVLLIVYENSNIDIIYPDKNVVNIPDIKLKNIVGGKHINSITFINGFAYLGCEFGIVVVDISRKEIKDTYYIGANGANVNVKGVAYDGTFLLAAAENGIYKAVFSDPNIFNYTAWTKDTTLTEPNANYTSTVSLDGKFYVVKTSTEINQDTVLVFANNQWSPFNSDPISGATVDTYNNMLIYLNKLKISAYDVNGSEIRFVDIYRYTNPDMRDGYLDVNGNFWIADFNNGLVCQKPDHSIQTITPNGPRSEAVWALAGSRGTLWVASGSMLGDQPNYAAKNGVSRFSDNSWTTYDCTNDALYNQLCVSGSKSVVCVAIDPSDPYHSFFGSWGQGILEYGKDGGITLYNESNSSIHAHAAIPGYLIVGGVAFDDQNNLWAVAGGNTQGVSVKKTDGTWRNFNIPDASFVNYGLYSLVIDDYGQKWFIARQGASTGEGLCVFKEKDLDNSVNVDFKKLTDREGNGALPHIFVRSLAKDKDGSVWIGTDKGVAVIYNPGNVFTGGNYDAQKIIIQYDGYNQYLLETEIVSAIAIDGANRKWFGTYSGGVFLMSADGTKQILNFNMDNSPLPTNNIQAIAIDDLTGEVFFGTDKGIFSYRGDATEGEAACNGHYVFPNPVRHEYRGPIAIRGLVANADVKIADVAGNVVFHTKANGGEAIWNGNNFSGERAQTGVYLVYVTNEDGSATCTTKFLFAN